MGCANSAPVDPEDRVATRQTAAIDKMIRMDKKVHDRTVKILLLGTSNKTYLPPSVVIVCLQNISGVDMFDISN